MSVRKAHNTGKNHLRNVVDYYQQIGHEKAQSVIDSITSSYAAEGQAGSNPMLGQQPGPGQGGFPPPPFGFPGGIPPPFGMPGGPPGGFPRMSPLHLLTSLPSETKKLYICPPTPIANTLFLPPAPGPMPGGRGMPPFPPFPPGPSPNGMPPMLPGGMPFPPPGGMPPNFQFPPQGFPPMQQGGMGGTPVGGGFGPPPGGFGGPDGGR
ncbi:hypothetical protein MMC14_003990 [Varicellaria rhodocarpa]|nr:hypothetical protein [Varicellaria rhodocarpa]